MKTLKLAAIMMITLVLSLPIAFAQELTIQKFQGKDNARGYSRVVDELTIEVLVKIPGESIIDREQVRLYVEDSFAFFDTCVADGTFHKCTFFEPEFESYEPIDFTIELRDDDGNIVASETKTLIVDNVGPVIKEVHIDPPVSSGTITVSYIAEDYGRTFGDVNECSGIKEIQITTGTKTVVENGEPGLCQKDNIVEMTIDTPGQKQVCVAAKDHVNYASSPVCGEVSIDKSPPAIETLEIRDDAGVRVTHVHQGDEILANAHVRITDDGEIDYNTVYANFIELNPNLYDELQPDEVNGNLFSWNSISVSEVSPCKVTVRASDILGNPSTKDFDCTIKADDTAPTYVKVVADALRDGVPLYGFDTYLTLEFDDKDNTGGSGIGMEQRYASLDLTPLGMGSDVAPEFCEKQQGSTWHCKWYLNPPITTPEELYTITLASNTADDLGNEIGQAIQFEMIYDNIGPKPPQVIDFKVISGEEGTEYTGGAVRGDYVQYKVRSGDFDTAFANFSGIDAGEEVQPIMCEDAEAELKDCTFEGYVALSGPYMTDVSFTFYDDALNKAKTNATLEIFGISNETNPNYWKKPTVTCSPRLIDRTTAKMFPPYVSCRIPLSSSRTDIEPLVVSGPTDLAQCTGDTEVFSDVYVTNNFQGSTTPFLFFVMHPQDLSDVDKSNINCPISIRTKIKTAGGSYVSQLAQELPVNITLEYYSFERDIHKGVDDKIKEAVDNSFAQQEWLGDLNKLLFAVEQGCYLKNVLANVIGAVSSVVMMLGGLGGALETSVYPPTVAAGKSISGTAGALCNIDINLGDGYKTVKTFLDTICAFANCELTKEAGGGYLGENFLAGAVPWCSDVKEFFSTMGGNIPEWEMITQQAQMNTVNVKDSIILSTLCLCVPGIISNLEKMRQIECFKAVCYHDYVKEEGYPLSMCQSEYHYLWCTYVIGELFALFPFAQFFDKLIDMAVSIISNPLIAAGMLLELGLCRPACQQVAGANIAAGATTELFVCAGVNIAMTLVEAAGSVKQLIDTKFAGYFKPQGNQYCKRMEDISNDLED